VKNNSGGSTALGAAAGIGEGSVYSTAVGNWAEVQDGAGYSNVFGYDAKIFTGADHSSVFGQGARAYSNASHASVFGAGASAGEDATDASVFGAGASVSDGVAGGVAVGANANSRASGGAAFGTGAQALGTNSVALGANSIADQDNTVSVGSEGAERRITNVAAGIAPTDAVNVSQLGSAIDGVRSDVNNLRKESRRGIAAAVALASPIMPSAPGKTTISSNVGFYENEVGLGVSIAHRLSTTLPIMLHGDYANGGGGSNVGRVGAAVEF
jgi:autotransporter adhesin